MSQRICIAVVDCIDSNAFRVSNPSTYAPVAKVSEEERREKIREQMARGGWPPYEDEDVSPTDFERIVKKIGKHDEFRVGYLDIPDDIGKPFFNNAETQSMFAKYNPRVINREDYQVIIETMRKIIADKYYEIVQDKQNWQGVLESKMEMWTGYHGPIPYDLDFDTASIVNLYDPEIQIWDLVRMYKAIDWMGENVVLYNW